MNRPEKKVCPHGRNVLWGQISKVWYHSDGTDAGDCALLRDYTDADELPAGFGHTWPAR